MDEVQKKNVAKLKAELAKMDEVFYDDFDRLAEKYYLSKKSVMAICIRAGKFDADSHFAARRIEIEELNTPDTSISKSRVNNADKQYGVLQPVANTSAGCFSFVAWSVLIILVVAAFASLTS